jgi:hypothetical protein
MAFTTSGLTFKLSNSSSEWDRATRPDTGCDVFSTLALLVHMYVVDASGSLAQHSPSRKAPSLRRVPPDGPSDRFDQRVLIEGLSQVADGTGSIHPLAR